MLNEVLKLLKYKAWANDIMFSALSDVADGELYKVRETNFKTIISTLNHVFVVDDIFKSHILSQNHPYTSRNTESHPALIELGQKQQVMDQWYLDFASKLDPQRSYDVINFEFVGGREGKMSIMEILFHIVNHGTYHRGFVSDMMYQIPVKPPANDLTVYLRDVYHNDAH
jgi:uncharacterized damage-inducible protein DinB